MHEVKQWDPGGKVRPFRTAAPFQGPKQLVLVGDNILNIKKRPQLCRKSSTIASIASITSVIV